MIVNLDKQLGVVSEASIDAATEHNVKSTNQASAIINTEHVHDFNSKQETKKDDPKKDNKKENKNEKDETKKEINSTSNAHPVTKKEKAQPVKEDPTIALFNECDLRVGKVVELKNKESSDEIYELKIDLGEKELRNIGTGLRKYVPAEEIFGRFVIVFANLKPKKLGNFVSEGMVLCSYTEDDSKFELPRPSDNSKPGDSVFIDGSNPKETLLAPLNDKKFKKAIDLFKTDSNCVAGFDGRKMQTSSGVISVKSLANCTIS
jgi:methionine--tRNA ligase beta chain